MNAPRSAVLVVGESLVDIVEGPRRSYHRPGGSPLNVAVGLGRLGVRVSLATQLAADAQAQMLRRHLQVEGVELIELAPTLTSTSTATATAAEDGSVDYRFDLAWSPRGPLTVDIASYDMVHVGSLAAFLEPGAHAIHQLVEEAAAQRVPISFDPNIRAALTPRLDRVRDRVEHIARHARMVKLSSEDAQVLWPDLDPTAAAVKLQERCGFEILAVTAGPDGMIIRTGVELQAVPARPGVLVDTIGAGDAVTSTLIKALGTAEPGPGTVTFTGTRMRRAAALAMAAAAYTCAREGSDPPTEGALVTMTGDRPAPAGSGSSR